MLDAIEELLRGSQPLFAQGLTDAILGGWAMGADSIAETLPAGIDFSSGKIPPIPPAPPDAGGLLYPDSGDGGEPLVKLPAVDNAVERLASLRVVQPDEFARLSARARQQAFTIAGDLTDSAIDKVRELLRESAEQGPSLRSFRDAVEEEFDGMPLADAHLEQVYRNAVNEAYSQGAETILDHPMVDDGFPYRRYVPIHDARARKEHLALESMGLNGTAVYHKDDPTWRRFRPPWSFNCRCGWIALSVESAARMGVREAQRWLNTGVEPSHEYVPSPPFSPPLGWERAEVLA